jgi:hypothetical protein
MTAADPLPAGVIHAIVDCAYQLSPGTSAERWAELMEPEPEPDPDAEAEAEAEADDLEPWAAEYDVEPEAAL